MPGAATVGQCKAVNQIIAPYGAYGGTAPYDYSFEILNHKGVLIAPAVHGLNVAATEDDPVRIGLTGMTTLPGDHTYPLWLSTTDTDGTVRRQAGSLSVTEVPSGANTLVTHADYLDSDTDAATTGLTLYNAAGVEATAGTHIKLGGVHYSYALLDLADNANNPLAEDQLTAGDFPGNAPVYRLIKDAKGMDVEPSDGDLLGSDTNIRIAVVTGETSLDGINDKTGQPITLADANARDSLIADTVAQEVAWMNQENLGMEIQAEGQRASDQDVFWIATRSDSHLPAVAEVGTTDQVLVLSDLIEGEAGYALALSPDWTLEFNLERRGTASTFDGNISIHTYNPAGVQPTVVKVSDVPEDGKERINVSGFACGERYYVKVTTNKPGDYKLTWMTKKNLSKYPN